MLGTSTSQDIQEICRISWILKVHYRINKSITPVLILSQINPVHAHPDLFIKSRVTINLPSTPQFFKWPPTLRFPHRNHVCKYPHSCHISRPSLSFELITRIICVVLHSLVTTSCFGPNIFFKTLLPNTLKLWSPLTTKKGSFTPI